MKLKALTSAIILAAFPAAGAFAAAMDRSGQSISAFLQPGNYAEAGITVLDPSLSGKDTSGNSVSDMAGDYQFANAAVKVQLNDHYSLGLIYDQPFGADAEYSGVNNFTIKPTDIVAVLDGNPITGEKEGVAGQGTTVEVKSQNLALLFGFQPNSNWNFYAGPVYQTIEGHVSLRGAAYGGAAGFGSYDANFSEESGIGWLAGFSYQIPEIALKTSLTYRSEIDHDFNAHETLGFGTINPAALGATPGETTITTPQSVNLDFQTGIMANTVAFANVRWVNWGGFAIQPHQFAELAENNPRVGKKINLVDYSDDQWSANVGVGRKLNDKWAGNVSVGWDSGAGNPVTTLGPYEGYWNVGLGAQYSPAPNYFIAGGVKYLWLGDATAKTAQDNNVGTFSDNNAIAYGLKIGYKF